MLTLHHLTCEYFTNPLGLDVRQPRLSWKSSAPQRGARQTAYQICVADTPALLTAGQNLLWDTGKVPSAAAIHLPYAGADLRPGQRCYWRVRVWDENDVAAAWSEIAFWEMGLLETANWQAQWITPDWDEDISVPQPAPLLRRAFQTDGAIVRARIYATSLGLYELHLNGQRVGDALLTPGWTSYQQRLQYQTYDVTDLLRTGDNALGALLGDGWYRGHLGFQRQRNMYGDRLALLLQLEITYADGRTQTIGSDETWQATTGPIRLNDLYWGEAYDAQLEKTGWDQAGYNADDWQGVRLLDFAQVMPQTIIVAQIAPPVRRQETIRPQRILHSPKGETILDFGQNMVGWVRLTVTGKAGTTITIRHAEVLDQQGNLYTENLRFAKQELNYTLKGQGEERYEPHFSFMGFQFIAVENFPGELTLDNFTGIVVHSEIPPIGTFDCSNPMINQLQHNIVWGQKGNFVDVPTDCPQRDERLGWTGDAQAFIGTAAFNRDVAAFFTKWLGDLRADQQPSGSVAFVVPDVITPRDGSFSFFSGSGAAAWGDAATIIPWTLYQSVGDTRLLAESYASMVAWVEWVRRQTDADLIWRKGFQFGDWLDYRGAFALKASPVTNDELVATAFFAYSSDLLAQAAGVLGKSDDAATYATLANQVKAAFCTEFLTAGGRVGPNSQTAYVLALHFDLLPEAARPQAAARLAEIVRNNNYHLTTGFAGTPYLCHVLSRFGQTDVAYELLNQESFPSWLYPVKRGATTIWERWDGIKPDGSFQDAGMNSFNHYAYGAIGEWLYRVVAGIVYDSAEPGYKHILIQPQPGGGLTQVRATLDAPYGLIEVTWLLTDQDFRLNVTVPTNSHATIRLPATALDQVREGGQPVTTGQLEDGVAIIPVESGRYEFVTTAINLAQVMAKVRHVAGRLDRYSSLGDVLANEKAKAALIAQTGAEFLQSPMLGFVINGSLTALAEQMPQVLTPEKLDALEAAMLASA
ncbi:MAG: glycoside hydrolase family 78 protein [Chloroflexi bacterium]|nr:glycoside hydrolase family 78 protein [Chloroflexota bacterium]